MALAALLQSVQAAPLPGYRLAWQDEFDGTAVDETKWQYRTDVRYWSTQLPQNVSVSDGLLHLNLKKETVGTTSYTAGGLISRQLFRYGYYETRMKVPPSTGWHTSFWMMQYNRPADATVATELDVIENDSINPLLYGVNTHRHLPTPHTTYGTKNVTTPSLSTDFHVFGCEFTPTVIHYYFDGTLVQTVDATQFEHDDLNIWLTSIAAPLGGTTSVDDSQLPTAALYDWVRYYEPFPAPTVVITNPSAQAVMLGDVADEVQLDATVTIQSGTPNVAWSCVSGPGTVTFSDATSAHTTARLSTPGNYLLQCAATNDGGTSTDQVQIGIGSPITLTLRRGTHGYSHTATMIRSDHTDWNAGARDQVLVGRTTGLLRSLFSFDLTPLPAGAQVQHATLELTTVAGGTGTVGTLELRHLSATPVEGSGIADGSSSNIGTGTGTTWLTRTGGSAATDLWTTPGSDFDTSVLTSLVGFDATLPGQIRTLPDSPAFVAAINSARAAGQPLDLILTATNETASTTAYTRLASDDASDETTRPALKLTFTGNQLPSPDPGQAPDALAAAPVTLAGSTNGAVSSLWQCTAGPAPVVFADPGNPAAIATFPQPGIYQLDLAATNVLGTVRRTLAVTVAPNPATFSGWQQLTWPGSADPAVTGPNADPDHDGRPNLLEWALALDPARADAFATSLDAGESGLTFSYVRRKIVFGEAIYQVEWSDNLDDGWSSSGVSEDAPVALTGETESVLARLPAGAGGRRFVRLRVSQP